MATELRQVTLVNGEGQESYEKAWRGQGDRKDTFCLKGAAASQHQLIVVRWIVIERCLIL